MVAGELSYAKVKRALLTPSRDRTSPVGYKLSVIPFANGEPVAGPDNKTAAIDILTNADNSRCPTNCFRPVGIAFDQQGRLFMSSDATGDIFVVMRDQASQGSTGTTTTSGVPSPTAPPTGTGRRVTYNLWGFLLVLGLSLLAL